MRTNPFNEIFNSETYKNAGKYVYRFPKIVDIELTNNCNLNCKMCARQNMTRYKGFMSKETFDSVTIDCVRNNAAVRMIGWGEPFLHPQIIDFCRLFKYQSLIDPVTLKETKPPLHITNNGQIITKIQMKELVEMELDSIIFSFQGATKEGYEAMRVGSNYDRLESNIKQFVAIRGEKEKPFIQVTSTMTFETADEIQKFKEYWEKIVDSVVVGKTQPLDHSKEEYVYYKPCTEVFNKLTVKWDGRVSACCGDYNNELVVGSLGQNSLQDIWNNNKTLEAIRTLLTNNNFRTLSLCKNCAGAYETFI